MIKDTVITLAFVATLAERHPQPDILHKNYPIITENGIRVYGNMYANQHTDNIAAYFSSAMLITRLS